MRISKDYRLQFTDGEDKNAGKHTIFSLQVMLRADKEVKSGSKKINYCSHVRYLLFFWLKSALS